MGRISGKSLQEFDFDIDANPSEIKSQQPYRTSPRKRQMIQEAVRKLQELDIVEPATADIAQITSPVVIVIQKGKPRFCIDFREINSKTKPDRYAFAPSRLHLSRIIRCCMVYTYGCKQRLSPVWSYCTCSNLHGFCH